MGIYLGSTALGGGGASVPVGGLAYFIPPAETTFTSGQELYTDEDDKVWLRSGARITSAGTGALNADLYSNTISNLEDTTNDINVVSGSLGSTRARISNLGGGIIGTSGTVNNYTGAWAISSGASRAVLANGTLTQGLFDASDSGTGLGNSSGPVVDRGIAFGGAAGNNTHAFIPSNISPATGAWVSRGSDNRYVARYIPHTSLTSATTTATLQSNTNTFLAPSIYSNPSVFNTSPLFMAVTNSGLSTERHWFILASNDAADLVLTEFTFNSTTANGGEPWTATGNTIDLPTSVDGQTFNNFDAYFSLSGEGNSLHIKYSNVYLEYNATTRTELQRMVDLPTNDSLLVLPASQAVSSVKEYLLFGGSGGVANIYDSIKSLTAPYVGSYGGTRTPLTITDNSGTVASDGRHPTLETDIYLWVRIA